MFSCITGTSAHLMHAIEQLHFRETDRIADVTHGEGRFWRKINTSLYDFCPSDLHLGDCPKLDFRALPYDDASFDVVVYDPPFVRNKGHVVLWDTYNSTSVPDASASDILSLFKQGLTECARVSKRLVVCKCMDQSEAGRQCWHHIDIVNFAGKLGLALLDFFILKRDNGRMPKVNGQQKHARKNHSYLLVFKRNPLGR